MKKTTDLLRYAIGASLVLLFAGAAHAQDTGGEEKPKEKKSALERWLPFGSSDKDELKETMDPPGDEEELAETLDVPDDGDALLAPAQLSPAAKASAAGVTCGGEGVCMVDSTGQPLRVLPRSFTALYASPSASGEILSNAVSAFKPAFVFDRRGVDLSDPTDPKGWYQIGYSQRSAIGWMKAADVLEWRQALLLEFVHPGSGKDRRSPVVMFSDRGTLESVVQSNNRSRLISDILSDIESGDRPEGVIGREPVDFLNINETFYFLPIIQWSEEESFDEPSHYLQVFAAVPGSRAQEAGEGTIEDEDFLAETLDFDRPTTVDIVFVMDMTGSMQRYIDRVKDAVVKVAQLVDSKGSEDVTIRFGLVGYRDSVAATPGLDWATKDFTPEFVDGAELVRILEEDATPAGVTSDEWAEDVHGGYLAGVESNWREEEETSKIRILVLIGDASGHDVRDERKRAKNSSGLTEEELSQLAIDKGIYTYAVYLQDDRAQPDWDKGIDQFSRLARVPDGVTSGAIGIDANASAEDAQGVMAAVEFVGKTIVGVIEGGKDDAEAFTEGTGEDLSDEVAPDASEETAMMIDVAKGVLQAAVVDWLGDSTQAPKDFVSWVFDQDIADLNRPALSVRVLVTREQLDNMLRQSEMLLDALDNNLYGQVDFLTALKLASAQTSLGVEVNPDLSLGEQDFLPKWVAALPYRSRVLGMTPTEFTNLSTSERMEFRASLESKYKSYREIAGTPELWIKLDAGDTELQEVAAISLSLLP